MQQIEELLFDGGINDSNRLALTGLGGIGKSRCAMEFAYRTKEIRPGYSVFWVQATNLETVRKGYHYIAKTLRLRTNEDIEDSLELVRQHLSSQYMRPYLLIPDDADDSSLWVRGLPGGASSRPILMDYIPRHPQGAVLLTTRSRQVATRTAGNRVLSLDMLDADSACLLFHDHLHNPVVHPEEATEIVRWLTHCPLAVMRAAEFINETGTRLSTLLRLFEKDESTIVELLGTDADDIDHDRSEPTTKQSWLLSLDHIRREDPHAFRILAYMC